MHAGHKKKKKKKTKTYSMSISTVTRVVRLARHITLFGKDGNIDNVALVFHVQRRRREVKPRAIPAKRFPSRHHRPASSPEGRAWNPGSSQRSPQCTGSPSKCHCTQRNPWQDCHCRNRWQPWMSWEWSSGATDWTAPSPRRCRDLHPFPRRGGRCHEAMRTWSSLHSGRRHWSRSWGRGQKGDTTWWWRSLCRWLNEGKERNRRNKK